MHAARFKSTSTLRFVLVLFALLSTCFALAEIEIPSLTSPVIDDGEFFTREEEQQLTERLRRMYAAGGPQMQIWTLPTLEGEPIESLSIRAAESWKLGKGKQDNVSTPESDNGLLLTIAKQERRYRLEVGQGLEGTIPDLIAARLLRSTLQPALRKGIPAAGVQSLINQIAELTKVDAGSAPTKKQFSGSLLIPLLFAVFIVLSLFNRVSEPRGWHGSSRGYWGGGSGWGGGRGGGWSGGGGGFSGGGSSGGW